MTAKDDRSRPSPLLAEMADSIRRTAKESPLSAYIAAYPDEMRTFLQCVVHVLRSRDELGRREFLGEGTKKLFNLAFVEYLSRSPELDLATIGERAEPGNALSKLIFMAAHCSKFCEPPNPLPWVGAIKRIAADNPERIANWAESIQTPEQMWVKFGEWRDRGILTERDLIVDRNVTRRTT